MSNHNKIRPVDKNNLSGKYKILFTTPQTKNSNIPIEFRGLQIYSNKSLAEEAPLAYKDVSDVIQSVDAPEISPKVVRVEPVGVCKG